MDVTPLIIHSRFINIRCPEKDMVQIVCPKIDTGIVSGFTLSMTSLHIVLLNTNGKFYTNPKEEGNPRPKQPV